MQLRRNKQPLRFCSLSSVDVLLDGIYYSLILHKDQSRRRRCGAVATDAVAFVVYDTPTGLEKNTVYDL